MLVRGGLAGCGVLLLVLVLASAGHAHVVRPVDVLDEGFEERAGRYGTAAARWGVGLRGLLLVLDGVGGFGWQ